MSGPAGAIARNVMNEVDAAVADESGWDWFKNNFAPAAVADSFRPEDQVLKALFLFAQTETGAKAIAWLHELSDRAPYPMIEGSFEQAALAAAKHQGRAGVGHVLSKAVAEGKRLIELNRRETAALGEPR